MIKLCNIIRTKLHLFCALSLLFIIISSITIIQGKRDLNAFVFSNCDDFFADTFNIYVYLDSQNIYAGDTPFTTGYYGHSIPRFYRNNPPMVFLHFDILRHLLRSRNMHLFLAVYVSIIFSLPFFYLLYRKLKGSDYEKMLFCASILFSGLFIFSLERGNIIMVTMCYVAFYIFAVKSTNAILQELALISLAMATALKVYPAILGLILVFDKQWDRCMRLFFYGILLSFLPFLWFPGGLGLIPDLMFNVFSTSSLVQPPFMMFCTWIPVFQKIFPGTTETSIQQNLYYLGLMISILSCVAAFFEKTMWRKMTLLVMVLLLSPKIGGWYNFLYLIPCLVLFLNDKGTKQEELLICALFALILSPPLISWRPFGLDSLELKFLAMDLFVIVLLYTSARDTIKTFHHISNPISSQQPSKIIK